MIPILAQPGQTWWRFFKKRQQPAQFVQALGAPLADGGTVSMLITGFKSVTGLVVDGGTGASAPSSKPAANYPWRALAAEPRWTAQLQPPPRGLRSGSRSGGQRN